MGLIPNEFRGPLGRLREMRNRFAHGKLHDTTVSDARTLYAACREMAPEIEGVVPQLQHEQQAEIHLANLCLMLEIGLEASLDAARERRAREEAARHAWFAAHALSAEEIALLLGDEGAAKGS
jgi:hypothetical protein